MQASYVTFPTAPNAPPKRSINVASDTGKVSIAAFVSAAGEEFTPTSGADYSVNGELTTDPNTEVPDGAVVQKTERVAGA